MRRFFTQTVHTFVEFFFFCIQRLFSSIKTDGSVGGTMQELHISIHGLARGKFYTRRLWTEKDSLFLLQLQITFLCHAHIFSTAYSHSACHPSEYHQGCYEAIKIFNEVAVFIWVFICYLVLMVIISLCWVV